MKVVGFDWNSHRAWWSALNLIALLKKFKIETDYIYPSEYVKRMSFKMSKTE